MTRPWSCDSMVALPDASGTGRTMFAKNSDRPAGEPQPMRRQPARRPGAPLALARVELADTGAYAHLGSGPSWCWGYEMGVNEHRLAIGNEALFTRPWAAAVDAAERGEQLTAGLNGMELVRLGLERAASAAEAVDVMTGLLEQHGQWGSATLGKNDAEGSYDNAYLLADPHEAWVLETAGRQWAARKITRGTYTISNEPSIRTEADRTSAQLTEEAVQQGWWPAGVPLDFAAAYVDPRTPLQVSHIRRQRSGSLLAEAAAAGGVRWDDLARTLGDHLEGTFLAGPYFDAALPDFHTLCMHEHPAGFTWGNTAASTIIELDPDPHAPIVMWWCPVTPCTGVYIPFVVGGAVPAVAGLPSAPEEYVSAGETPSPRFDVASLWWQFQNLLDAAKEPMPERRFSERQQMIRSVFDPVQQRWRERVAALTPDDDPAVLTQDCVDEALRLVEDLIARLGAPTTSAVDPRWR